MSQYLFLLISVFVLISCSGQPLEGLDHSDDEKPIVGGELMSSENPQSKYVVMIYGEDTSGVSFICTGTFISSSLILTAGHCLSEDVSRMSIFYGPKPFGDVAGTVPVIPTRLHLHPEYKIDDAQRNDLGLIEFSGGLPKGAQIAEIESFKSLEGQMFEAFLIGYGRSTDDEEHILSDDLGLLRGVVVNGESFSIDKKDYSLNQLSGKGVCFGDSGGPALRLVKPGVFSLMGVASGVIGDPHDPTNVCRYKSIYMTPVDRMDWIQKYLKK